MPISDERLKTLLEALAALLEDILKLVSAITALAGA